MKHSQRPRGAITNQNRQNQPKWADGIRSHHIGCLFTIDCLLGLLKDCHVLKCRKAQLPAIAALHVSEREIVLYIYSGIFVVSGATVLSAFSSIFEWKSTSQTWVSSPACIYCIDHFSISNMLAKNGHINLAVFSPGMSDIFCPIPLIYKWTDQSKSCDAETYEKGMFYKTNGKQ